MFFFLIIRHTTRAGSPVLTHFGHLECGEFVNIKLIGVKVWKGGDIHRVGGVDTISDRTISSTNFNLG